MFDMNDAEPQKTSELTRRGGAIEASGASLAQRVIDDRR